MRWLLSRSEAPKLSIPIFLIVVITRSFVTSFVVSGMPEMRRLSGGVQYLVGHGIWWDAVVGGVQELVEHANWWGMVAGRAW